MKKQLITAGSLALLIGCMALAQPARAGSVTVNAADNIYGAD